MRLLIFISILLSVMYATNPTASNFSSFVADRISEKAREEGAKEDLSNLAGGIASMYVKKNVQRTNYHVISTYFLDMSLFRDFGRKDLEDIFVLGIFNFFLPLN